MLFSPDNVLQWNSIMCSTGIQNRARFPVLIGTPSITGVWSLMWFLVGFFSVFYHSGPLLFAYAGKAFSIFMWLTYISFLFLPSLWLVLLLNPVMPVAALCLFPSIHRERHVFVGASLVTFSWVLVALVITACSECSINIIKSQQQVTFCWRSVKCSD